MFGFNRQKLSSVEAWAALATFAGGVVMGVVMIISLIFNFWVEVDVTPKVNYAAVVQKSYLDSKKEAFNAFFKSWADMRIGYDEFFEECERVKMIPKEKLKEYAAKNNELIQRVRRVGSANTYYYYFGYDLLAVTRYDIENLYLKYQGVCPKDTIKIKRMMLRREVTMKTLALSQMYNSEHLLYPSSKYMLDEFANRERTV